MGGCANKNQSRGGTWNEVRVYGVTIEAEIMSPVQAIPHLLEYMDLQMEALDEELLRNDLDAYWGGDCSVIMKGMKY
jgi:hypothetical protein